MAGGEQTFPTSEAIAQALWGVALAMRDDGYLADAARWPGRDLGYSAWIVLAALDATHPSIELERKAFWLGLNRWSGFQVEATLTAQARLGLRRRMKWWREDLVRIAFAVVAP